MSIELRQLLIATHGGHEPSARDLWHIQAPRLVHYARAIVRSAADAEDVVQSVFCRVLAMPRREIESVDDPAAWLARVTRHEALNALRSARRERARRTATVGREIRVTLGSTHDPELQEAIALLPRRLREIVVLKHVAGLTFDQIAIATGLNRNTAADRYRVGLQRLRSLLESAPRPYHPAPASPRTGEVHHAR